ncbi:MAG TPA: hypothetical protein VF576_07325, partial [Rubricoccaceae bacterium]
MPTRYALLATLALALVRPAAAQAPSQLETAFPSLSFTSPIEFTHANDGSGRVYVAEKAGRVRSFDNLRTTATATLALDITGVVRDDGGEQGLLGMAFHPNHAV